MISLEASTRTCKVDTASAARSESDRFLNPNNVVCIPWNGRDLAGRVVSADSFYTKTSGCNSAADRVIVENALRPQYFEYINLNDYGVRADMYGENMNFTDAGVANRQLNGTQKYAGSFNLQPGGQFEPTCSYRCIRARAKTACMLNSKEIEELYMNILPYQSKDKEIMNLLKGTRMLLMDTAVVVLNKKADFKFIK